MQLWMPIIRPIVGHCTHFNLSGSGRRVNCHRVGLGHGSNCLTRFHLWQQHTLMCCLVQGKPSFVISPYHNWPLCILQCFTATGLVTSAIMPTDHSTILLQYFARVNLKGNGPIWNNSEKIANQTEIKVFTVAISDVMARGPVGL